MSKNAFTFEFDKGVRPILPVKVYCEEKGVVVQALWDTGANMCCISQRLVNELRISKAGDAVISSVVSAMTTEYYSVSLLLPAKVKIEDVKAILAPMSNKNYDFIIGINIMNFGDFAISNLGEKSVLTFRAPSEERIDFTK